MKDLKKLFAMLPTYNEEIKRYEENKELEAVALSNTEYWIEEGKKLIFPEKHNEWEEYVNNSARFIYHGSDVDVSLTIMKLLENDSENSIAKIILQNYSTDFKLKVMNTIFHFSKNGPDYIENIYYENNLPNELIEIFKNKKQQNEILEKNKKLTKK